MEKRLLSDERLVEMIVKGRAELFDELVERYRRPVTRLACSILGREDAEDAAQEVFIRAYKSISNYRESGRFWCWLRRITINVCLKRTRPVVISLDEINEIPSHEADCVSRSVIDAIEAAELKSIIQELPPAYRYVIVLKYLEDMNYSEIAEILGESVSNVGVRLHRAKEMLRARMKVDADDMQRI
jgi:RNA polymerase sigma-70 factor (ECF subfamily)